MHGSTVIFFQISDIIVLIVALERIQMRATITAAWWKKQKIHIISAIYDVSTVPFHKFITKKNLFLTTRACFNGICIMRHIFFTDFRKFIGKKNLQRNFPFIAVRKNAYQKYSFSSYISFNFDDVTYQYKNRTYQPNQG